MFSWNVENHRNITETFLQVSHQKLIIFDGVMDCVKKYGVFRFLLPVLPHRMVKRSFWPKISNTARYEESNLEFSKFRY